MKQLPQRPNIDHLKRQAKDLLVLYRSRDLTAIARFRSALPAAAGKDDQAISQLGLRLHDAQSCLAREYGFSSWADLKSFVEVSNAQAINLSQSVLNWLRLIYAGDIAGGANRARPSVAARLLKENPSLIGDDPYVACAIGDLAKLRQATKESQTWVNTPGGPLNLPTLVAVTHSSLLRLADFCDPLRASAKFLLDAGADPNQAAGSRWPPASLSEPSETFRLSALYGAAGQNHDPELTRLLLEAGADPNDNESLYHSLESRACTRLLLDAGARIAGSNALYRVLDLDDIDALRLLLSRGANANEPATSSPTADWGSPLLWAIRRRRSRDHISALLDAGADPLETTPDGVDAYTLAQSFGLVEVADLLRKIGAPKRRSLLPPAPGAIERLANAFSPNDPTFPAPCPRRNFACCRSLPRSVATTPSGSWWSWAGLSPHAEATGMPRP
jgi:ankyrin repeat protein